MTGITILGSTGSIGLSTLDVMSRHRDLFEPVALTANTNIEELLRQCLEWRPKYAVMADPASASRLRDGLRRAAPGIRVMSGPEGLQEVAGCAETDYVMAAIVRGCGACFPHWPRRAPANGYCLPTRRRWSCPAGCSWTQ